jgi:hypothetical protein
MKRILIAGALTCVIASAAFGGEIPSVGLNSEKPDETITSTLPGEIPSVGREADVADLTLDLVQLVVGLVL